MSSGRLSILHAVCTREFAGVEQFIVRLALAQSEAGHEVRVAGGDPIRMRAALSAAGVAFSAVSTTIDTARAIRARLDRVDVVNSHMTAADTSAVMAVMGRTRRPTLISTRHFAKRRGRLAPLDPVLDPWFDADIAISDYVADAIGVPSTVVHPGVAARRDGVGAHRERVVLMAQRLQPEKHSPLGIRAFAASGLIHEGWSLEVAGDGPDRGPAERLAHELGVASATRFLGFRDDVEDLMVRSSILLATCPVEGFGLTVLEAMASGLPVIAPAAGGPAEVLESLDPRALFPVDDAAHAGAQLRALALDDAGRQAYGEAARARQRQRFTVEAQARRTESVYRAARPRDVRD